MVFNPEIFNFLPTNSDEVMLEEVFDKLVQKKELAAYNHKGFWFGMDTQRDKKQLEDMWNSRKCKMENMGRIIIW